MVLKLVKLDLIRLADRVQAFTNSHAAPQTEIEKLVSDIKDSNILSSLQPKFRKNDSQDLDKHSKYQYLNEFENLCALVR